MTPLIATIVSLCATGMWAASLLEACAALQCPSLATKSSAATALCGSVMLYEIALAVWSCAA